MSFLAEYKEAYFHARKDNNFNHNNKKTICRNSKCIKNSWCMYIYISYNQAAEITWYNH